MSSRFANITDSCVIEDYLRHSTYWQKTYFHKYLGLLLIAAIMVVIINIVQRSLGDVVMHIGPAGVGTGSIIVIINIVQISLGEVVVHIGPAGVGQHPSHHHHQYCA